MRPVDFGVRIIPDYSGVPEIIFFEFKLIFVCIFNSFPISTAPPSVKLVTLLLSIAYVICWLKKWTRLPHLYKNCRTTLSTCKFDQPILYFSSYNEE